MTNCEISDINGYATPVGTFISSNLPAIKNSPNVHVNDQILNSIRFFLPGADSLYMNWYTQWHWLIGGFIAGKKYPSMGGCP
jgi:hypothetical protein